MASVTWMYIVQHFCSSWFSRILYLRFYVLITFNFVFTGILLSSSSPPVSTPLEPCRVAPYVNLPSIRASSITPATTSASHQYPSGAAVAAAFSAFDPALLSVAHQVSLCIPNVFQCKKFKFRKLLQNRKTFLIENNLFFTAIFLANFSFDLHF